jgi:hypothetical protein
MRDGLHAWCLTDHSVGSVLSPLPGQQGSHRASPQPPAMTRGAGYVTRSLLDFKPRLASRRALPFLSFVDRLRKLISNNLGGGEL